MHFTVIQIIIMFLIGYVCLYALIDRVMKHCATARAYGQFKESGAMIEMDDVADGIAKSKEEKNNGEKRFD